MVLPVANAAHVIVFATSSHPLAASSDVLEVRGHMDKMPKRVYAVFVLFICPTLWCLFFTS